MVLLVPLVPQDLRDRLDPAVDLALPNSKPSSNLDLKVRKTLVWFYEWLFIS